MTHLKLLLFVFLLPIGAHGQGRHARLLEVSTHTRYRPGAYTLADGTRHRGQLRIWQTLDRNIVQVDRGKADPLNLPAEAMQHFVMGPDSFVVAHRVAMAGAPAAWPFGESAFFRVLVKGKLQVLQHSQLLPIQGQYGGPSHLLTWVLRPTPDAELVGVPQEAGEFAKHVAGLFVAEAPLAQRIRAGMVGHNDFKRILYAYVFHKEIDQVTYEEAATLFP